MLLHFRCVKITLEEKTVTRIDGDIEHEKSVNVQFERAFDPKVPREVIGSFFSHGYIGLNMSIEEFNETRYTLGHVYSLNPT